jgi:hypothetical protein
MATAESNMFYGATFVQGPSPYPQTMVHRRQLESGAHVLARNKDHAAALGAERDVSYDQPHPHGRAVFGFGQHLENANEKRSD